MRNFFKNFYFSIISKVNYGVASKVDIYLYNLYVSICACVYVIKRYLGTNGNAHITKKIKNKVKFFLTPDFQFNNSYVCVIFFEQIKKKEIRDSFISTFELNKMFENCTLTFFGFSC